MNRVHLQITALVCLFSAAVAYAQSFEPAAISAVPKLVRFSGAFRPANGLPVQSVESVTLAVYRDQSGGAPLWQEIQNVAVDAEGHYSVVLGATKNEGMPLDLFRSGEPRWLGTQLNRPGEAEQPRVLLVSVPYALKASDAETLGGKPAAAYLLAPSAATSVGDGAVNSTTNVKSAVTPRTVSGQINRVAKFIDAANDVGNSSLYDANGFVGISTIAPLISLDVRTGSLPQMGIAGTTDYLTFFASDTFGPAIYWDPAKDMRFGKGGSGLYNPFGFVEQMRIQSSTGNVGIGTQSPGSKLDVNGNINFSGSILYQGSPVLQLSLRGTSGGNNMSVGVGALATSASGTDNTAIGFDALRSDTTGFQNVAVGDQALMSNTSGSGNTAIGSFAMLNNTLGQGNTASGIEAMYANTTGSFNVATGDGALGSNTLGDDNIATGFAALTYNTTGGFNVGYGAYALENNQTGNNNTAIGTESLAHTFASFNTAVGAYALSNIAVGSNNVAIGYQAGYQEAAGNTNSIYIGTQGSSSDLSGTVQIGTPGTQTSFFAAGIRGVSTGNPDAIPVVIDSNGQLGTVSSSRRFKDDIADMGEASRDLMRLRPVTYRYKKPFADGSKPVQYGLIAEEVSEVYPDLVAHSADGQIETVKYQVLDSMLLNEVQRQEAEIRGLEEQNRILKGRLDKLEKILTAIAR